MEGERGHTPEQAEISSANGRTKASTTDAMRRLSENREIDPPSSPIHPTLCIASDSQLTPSRRCAHPACTAAPSRRNYCTIYITDVLDMLSVVGGTKGTRKGNA
jgi:hypothetical protein